MPRSSCIFQIVFASCQVVMNNCSKQNLSFLGLNNQSKLLMSLYKSFDIQACCIITKLKNAVYFKVTTTSSLFWLEGEGGIMHFNV